MLLQYFISQTTHTLNSLAKRGTISLTWPKLWEFACQQWERRWRCILRHFCSDPVALKLNCLARLGCSPMRWQFWERSVSELQVASLLRPTINHPLLLPRLCLTHSIHQFWRQRYEISLSSWLTVWSFGILCTFARSSSDEQKIESPLSHNGAAHGPDIKGQRNKDRRIIGLVIIWHSLGRTSQHFHILFKWTSRRCQLLIDWHLSRSQSKMRLLTKFGQHVQALRHAIDRRNSCKSDGIALGLRPG